MKSLIIKFVTIFFIVLIGLILNTSCQPKVSKTLESLVSDWTNYPQLEVIAIETEEKGNTKLSLTDHEGVSYITTINKDVLSNINLKVKDQVKIAGVYAESLPIQILNVIQLKPIEE